MRERSRSPLDPEDDERGQRFDKQAVDSRRDRSPISGPSGPTQIYVANVPFELKWQDLKDIFRNHVGTVQHVDMFNDENGRPRGCAVVNFEKREMALKALDTMNRFEVKGRKLILREQDEALRSKDFKFMNNVDTSQRSRDRERRFQRDSDRPRRSNFERHVQEPPSQIGETYGLAVSFLDNLGINGPLVNKVFVANLDYKVTEKDLEEVFQVAGKVVKADLIKDLDDRSRGFAVVEFEHPVQAVQAISMLNNQFYHDRKLNVRMDRVTEKKNEPSNTKLPPGLKGLGMGLGMHGQAMLDASEYGNMSSSGSSMHGSSSISVMSESTQLPMNSMMDLPSHNVVRNNMNMLNMPGRGAMPDTMSAMNTMTMRGLSAAPFDAPLMNSMGMNSNGMSMPLHNQQYQPPMPNNNAYTTASAASYSQPPRTIPTSQSSSRTVVRVSNLPNDYNWQSLRDLCRDYGDIRFAEIRSQGVGLVRFANEAEAIRAADMLDRQRFDGRFLDACVV